MKDSHLLDIDEDALVRALKKEDTWWYKNVVKPYYHHYILFPWYDFKWGIKNIFRWIPILWKDRDYDSDYTITILVHKLKFQREYLDKNSIEVREHLNPKLANMDVVIALLDKIKNEWDNYEYPAIKKHEEKWGKSDIYFEPIEGSTNSLMKDKNKERFTEEELEQKSQEYGELLNEARKQRMEDFKRAMKIIVHKSDRWWH